MRKILKYLRYTDEFICCLSLLVVLVLVFCNVVSRWFFGKSLIITDSVAAMGFLYSIFFGVSVCYKRKMHIAIDVVINLFPPMIKRYIEKIIAVFMLMVNIFLAVFSLRFSISAMTKMNQVIPGLSFFWIDISMFIAFSLCSLYAIRDLVVLFRRKP
jgi:TRAP-type C4-dicarboxylate transport system permease small subunit